VQFSMRMLSITCAQSRLVPKGHCAKKDDKQYKLELHEENCALQKNSLPDLSPTEVGLA